MKAKLILFATLLFIIGTGFGINTTPKSIDISIAQIGNGNPNVIVLNDPGGLYSSVEQVEPGKFLVHYNPISCLYRNGFSVSNGGNLVDFPVERNFSLGYWVCGQAILAVTDLQGNYTNGFFAYGRITVYPGSQIAP